VARKLGTSRAGKAGVVEAVLVSVLLLGVIISHAELKKRQRRQAEHIANVAASVERARRECLAASSTRTPGQPPAPCGLCGSKPCNEGDLHRDRPPPGTMR